MSTCTLSPSTNTRLQTTAPGLQTPFSVPPPSRKYIGAWRSLTALAYPPVRCEAGIAPEICNNHT